MLTTIQEKNFCLWWTRPTIDSLLAWSYSIFCWITQGNFR